MRTATAILAVFLAGMAPPRTAGAQESQIILFDKKYSDLRAEYRKPVELSYVYDSWFYSDRNSSIDDSFGVSLVDLNNDGAFEVAILYKNILHGMVYAVTALIARKTESGWRFIGDIYAPEFSQHKSIPPRLAESVQIYVEDKTVNGWRIINNGPAWIYTHPYGETDFHGGSQYCWASRPIWPDQHDKHTRMGLPYDSGSPGYFNRIDASKTCPEN